MRRPSARVVRALTVLLLASGLASCAHLGPRSSHLVTLFANAFPGQHVPLQQVGPDGNLVGNFVLPPETELVVTDLLVSVNLVPAAGQTRGGLLNQALTGAVSPYFSFDATREGTQTIHLARGARWNQVPVAINAADSANAVFILVYGYLVKGK